MGGAGSGRFWTDQMVVVLGFGSRDAAATGDYRTRFLLFFCIFFQPVSNGRRGGVLVLVVRFRI